MAVRVLVFLLSRVRIDTGRKEKTREVSSGRTVGGYEGELRVCLPVRARGKLACRGTAVLRLLCFRGRADWRRVCCMSDCARCGTSPPKGDIFVAPREWLCSLGNGSLACGMSPPSLSTQAGLGEGVAVDLYKICVKYGKPRWNYARGRKKAAILSSWVRKNVKK